MKNEKKSYKERVLAFLKLDDDGKIEKFQKQAVKTWEGQVTYRKSEIAELEEKRAELLEEKADEIVLNVDVNRLKTIDDRDNYILSYQESLLSLKAKVDKFDVDIANKQKEIDGFVWLINQVK